jgi:hypothetical protein
LAESWEDLPKINRKKNSSFFRNIEKYLYAKPMGEFL